MDLGAESLFKPPRRGGAYVRLVPPSRHRAPSVTGGLGRLYEKIKKQEVFLPFDCEKYTNTDGSFSPVEGMPLLVDRYEYVEVIGQGQSSILLKAKDTFQGGREIAIKILHTHYSVLGSQEANCLQSLNAADPHGFSPILRLLTTFSIGRHFCLVFELLHCDPLANFFQQKKSPQERLRCIRKVALRLINAVGFLQSQNVIHADLKPDNLRLSEEGELASLKVVDFGNAIHCIHDELSLYYEDFELQTLLYRAPEVIFGLMFGVEVDMWSVGCILAELYVGHPLFHGRSMEAVLTRMQTLLGPLPKEVFQRGKFFQTLEQFTKHCVKPVAVNDVMQQLDCSDFPFIDFLLRLLKFNPASRMTVDQAAEHPFLAAELGLKYFKLKPCYESNANYPKTFLTPETYCHSQKPLRRNVSSDLALSQSTLQNLEALSLPKALKFLPRKIELLRNSGITSKPDVIGDALGGLSAGQRSISKTRSAERLETMDNNNGSIPRSTIKTEPIEFSPTTAEADVETSGVGLSMEISRTGQRSTERPGLNGVDQGFVLKERRIVSSTLSDATDDAKVTSNHCNFQQRRLNVDQIHKTSDAECVPAADQSDFDKLPNGFITTKLKTTQVLPIAWEIKDCVKVKNLKNNPALQNDQEMPARSLENGVCKTGKKDVRLLQAVASKASPGKPDRSKKSVESLLNVESRNETAKCSDVVPNCETRLEVLHSQPILEESNLVSGQSNGRSCLQTSQSTKDVNKMNGTSSKKDTVSNPNGSACTSLSDCAKDIQNRPKVSTNEKAAPRKDSALLNGTPQIAEEESASKIVSVDIHGNDKQQNTVSPTLNLCEIWQSLRQKRPVSDKNSSTVSDKNTSLQENKIDLPITRADDRFKQTPGRSGYKLENRREKSACEPTENINSASVAVLEDVEGVDSYPVRPTPSRKLSSGSVHQPVEEDCPRRLPAREEPERKSSSGSVRQQQSSSFDKRPTRNSHLDSTFIIEDHPDARRTPGKIPKRRPLQAERMQLNETVYLELPLDSSSCQKKAKNTSLDVTFSRFPNPRKDNNLETSREHELPSVSNSLITVDPELPLNSSSYRKRAKNTSNCLDVTFSTSLNPCKDTNLETSHKHEFLSSSDTLVTNSQKLNYAIPVVPSKKSFKSPRFGSPAVSQNVPQVRAKESAKSTLKISLSDCITSPPNKRRKLQSETVNRTVVQPTEPEFPYVNAVACSANGSNVDLVDSSKLAIDDGNKPQLIGCKKIAGRDGNVASRKSTVISGNFQFCKSPLNETFQLDEQPFVAKEQMTHRWQHKQISSPDVTVELLTNKTDGRKSYKFVGKGSPKREELYCYSGNEDDTSDVEGSDCCELDRSGYTVNKASLTLVSARSRDAHYTSTVCLSDDDDEEDDNDDEVVMLTP